MYVQVNLDFHIHIVLFCRKNYNFCIEWNDVIEKDSITFLKADMYCITTSH